ncbi:hypothetical protein [Xanthomonas sp. LMG 12461]|uniref:hypothetical protein n=1 Tax=Xanthomonas sp. LMG 12461 TaxID=2014543 RepID=UPI001265223E|nr:hypothetical protein [Xanthomonas sp. LMG 12461]KAB7761850.1 hypothetical protein CEK68_20555 [Xanthomonas sp. LMG 12461]
MKKPPQDPASTPPADTDTPPENPQRRRLLGGLALAGSALALGGPAEAHAESAKRARWRRRNWIGSCGRRTSTWW